MTLKVHVAAAGESETTVGLPLEGLRVLEIAKLAPAALVTRWLAELGADVLKVEEEGCGDSIRHLPPFADGIGLVHSLYDRGKSSIELGLRSGGGAGRLRELAMVADVIVDGTRPGNSERLGLDYSELRCHRPEVVVCSITGFGRVGPLAAMPAHGMTIDSMAGVADVHQRDLGLAIGGRFGSAIGVELGALQAVIGILVAVMNVRSGKEGAWLDISMWDAAVEANRLNVALARMDGEPIDTGAAYAVYETSDQRLFMLCAIERKFWERFCRAVERPDLIDKVSGNGAFTLGEEDANLGHELADIFKGRSAPDWTELFELHDIPGNVILDVEDVVSSAHFGARGLIAGTIGTTKIPNVLNPIMWDGLTQRLGNDLLPAPDLGGGGLDLAERWLQGREIEETVPYTAPKLRSEDVNS